VCIKTCLIKLTYYSKAKKHRWHKYHVLDLNLDKSVEDQIYETFSNQIPMFVDFKWTEVNI